MKKDSVRKDRTVISLPTQRPQQSAKKNISAQALPPVQRPGMSQPSRSGSGEADIAAMQRQMAGASPTKQMEIGAKILVAKRAARR